MNSTIGGGTDSFRSHLFTLLSQWVSDLLNDHHARAVLTDRSIFTPSSFSYLAQDKLHNQNKTKCLKKFSQILDSAISQKEYYLI